MGKTEQSWHSFFYPHECRSIDKASPTKILSFMQQYPEFDIRFLHHMIASDQREKALSVLKLIPLNERIQYINMLWEKLPKEFEYYADSEEPREQISWHAQTIPTLLIVAQEDGQTITDYPDSALSVIAQKKVELMNIVDNFRSKT